MMIELKPCTACGQEKPLSAFTKRSGSSSRRGTCRTCLRKRKRIADPPAAAGVTDRSVEAVMAAASEQGMPPTEGETGTAVPKPSRKRRRRKKKQADLRREDKQDEADFLEIADTADEPADGPADMPAEADDPAAAIAAVPSKPKRKRRRKRKKQTDLRRPDTQEPKDAAEVPQASEEVEETPTEEHAGHEPSASPRKRKRKRRRGNGKSAKRKPAAEASEAESAVVRPPDRIIIPVKGSFSFKTSMLNDRGRGMIRLRGKRETGKRWSTEIPMEMAVRMVEEGAAGIIHPGLIHKLYTKTDFRLLVLQRDDYICRYCGNFGDTIDHVMPKSKGGLSTPANCVCACADCNLKKADSLDYVDDEVLQHFLYQNPSMI